MERTFPRDQLFAIPHPQVLASLRQSGLFDGDDWAWAVKQASEIQAGPLPEPEPDPDANELVDAGSASEHAGSGSEDSSEGEWFAIEEIIDERVAQNGSGRSEILLRWQGYADAEWVAEEQLNGPAQSELRASSELRAWRRRQARGPLGRLPTPATVATSVRSRVRDVFSAAAPGSGAHPCQP